MNIVWSPLAIERVSEMATYIAEDNPVAAEEWVDAVFARVEGLQDFPNSGRIVPEVNNEAVRELVYGYCRLIYRLEEKRISVLAVRHGKQVLPAEDLG